MPNPITLANPALKPLTPCKDCERIEPTPQDTLPVALRMYLMGERDELLAKLARIEELLGMPRTVPSSRERRRIERAQMMGET